MSHLYLIRHGQAGTRQHYDKLSDLGRRQARLLGDYLASQNIRFHTALSGGLERQQQTAAQVAEAYRDANIPFPPIESHDAWREFDLDHVYRAMAPQLCAADPLFKADYEAERDLARASATDETAAIHRRWTPCDTKIFEAWLSARFPYDGESWAEFQHRVGTAPLPDQNTNVAVFTSATPTAIWAARALDIHDTRSLRIAAVLQNASFTVLRVQHDQVRLFSLNEVPHLTRPEWRTHR
jgi:broad specificity phosphatase PhoE